MLIIWAFSKSYSLITDHQNKYNNEKFEIFWELPKSDKDTKWANAVGKMVPMDLPNIKLPQTFNV